VKVIRYLAGAVLLSGPVGCAAESVALEEVTLRQEEQAQSPSGDFAGSYSDCDEFAGLGLVPLANVASYVPAGYTIIEAGPGLAIVVAQAGSCATIEVDGADAAPGIFAQFGVAVIPPDGTGNGNFYQIMFSTNHLRLAQRMKNSGAEAHFSPLLSYELTHSPDSLEVTVPQFPPLGWMVSGPVTFPDPTAPPNPTTVFNYWVKSKKNGNVRQRNTVTGIRFGSGQAVQLTALGAQMEAIIGGPNLTFPIFSNPEIFDLAELDVQTNVF
jgi:hypothetical protein